jgi:hypothetical protein
VEAAPAEEKTAELRAEEIKPAAVEPFIDNNGRLHLRTAQ